MTFLHLIFNHKSKFIVITFLVSVIGLFKNFIVLKILDLEALGLLTLSQTVVITISLLQFGVVTGGYRLFSYRKEFALNRVNSAVFVFFILLSILLLTGGFFVKLLFQPEIDTLFILFFIVIGISSLYANWVTCKILGIKNIVLLNKAQLASAIVSFIVTGFAYYFGLWAVFLGIILQPIILILVIYIAVPSLRPVYNFKSFKKIILKVISLGFIPYLTTALNYFNSQLGRWVITISLGTIILGKTFLVSLFISLVSVFPGAVSNLLFPSIIEKFEKNLKDELIVSLKRQFLVLFVYFSGVTLFTLLLAKVLVAYFLPKYLDSVYLIYAIIPSVIFLNLSSPSIIFFNAAKKFNQILVGSIVSIFSYFILLMVYIAFFRTNIVGFLLIESIAAFIFFLYNSYYFIYFFKTYRHANQNI
jgi:O-antigen/teichoic acid export membrane protein